MTIRHEYDEKLAVMAGTGMTRSQIAEEIGVSPQSIRAAAHRRGIVTVPDSRAGVRSIISDMPTCDAISYLLDCIDVLRGIKSREAPEDRWGVHMTRSQSRIMAALDERAPHVVSRDGLYNALYFDRLPSDMPEAKTIDVLVSQIRRKLPASFGAIETIWGQGYRLVKAGVVA